MRDVVTDADYEEWAAQAQAILRQQYADYERGAGHRVRPSGGASGRSAGAA